MLYSDLSILRLPRKLVAIRGLGRLQTLRISGILQRITEFVSDSLQRLQPNIFKVKLMHNTFTVFKKHCYLTRFDYLVNIYILISSLCSLRIQFLEYIYIFFL